jgi:hypothetical protein
VWSGLGLLGVGLPGVLLAVPAVPVAMLVWQTLAPFPEGVSQPFFAAFTALSGMLIPALWLGTRALGLFGPGRVVVAIGGFAVLGAVLALVLYAIRIAPVLPG